MSAVITKTPAVFFANYSYSYDAGMEIFDFSFTFSDVADAVTSKTPVFLVLTFSDYETNPGIPADKVLIPLAAITEDWCLFYCEFFNLLLTSSNEMSFAN